MKKMIKSNPVILICVILFLDSCDPTSIPCLPPSSQTDIAAFYTFSNGSLNDDSGNNQTLTNTTSATPAADRFGNPNCAFEFDNLPTSAEFLVRSNASFLTTLTDFSVSLWYQPLDPTRPIGMREFFVSHDYSLACPDKTGDWSVGLSDCRKAAFGMLNSVWDNDITADCNCESDARTNSWHHLVATYSQNTTEMKIYRDGILQDAVTGNANCAPPLVNSGILYIGKDYTGRLDDIVILSRVLSQSEVNDLYHLFPCCN